jgi:hypothetical protein
MNTAQLRYKLRRVTDLAAAMRDARAQMSREHGPVQNSHATSSSV